VVESLVEASLGPVHGLPKLLLGLVEIALVATAVTAPVVTIFGLVDVAVVLLPRFEDIPVVALVGLPDSGRGS
jgi:hypothetical protein